MKTKTIVYIGPFERVLVDMRDGTREHVDHGGSLTTTADHAASLLEQPSNWRGQTSKQAKEAQTA